MTPTTRHEPGARFFAAWPPTGGADGFFNDPPPPSVDEQIADFHAFMARRAAERAPQPTRTER